MISIANKNMSMETVSTRVYLRNKDKDKKAYDAW